MKYIKDFVDEDDLTVAMPDEMWQMIKAHVAWNDRGGVEEILRELVRMTKEKVKRESVVLGGPGIGSNL